MKIITTILITAFFIFSANAFNAKKYFKNKCAGCHTIGGGDKIGPDLAGLSSRRKLGWTVKFINNSEAMIHGDDEEKGYEKPDALAKKVYNLYKPQVMAGYEINKKQTKSLLKYIDSLKKRPKGKITTIK